MDEFLWILVRFRRQINFVNLSRHRTECDGGRDKNAGRYTDELDSQLSYTPVSKSIISEQAANVKIYFSISIKYLSHTKKPKRIPPKGD